MFEDIHKIDSTVFKPDPTKSKSDPGGRGKRKGGNNERTGQSSSPETPKMKPTSDNEENQEHPLLDIRV